MVQASGPQQMDQAQQEMQSIARGIERQSVDTNGGWTVNVVRLQEQLVGNVRTTLFTLLGAVCFAGLLFWARMAAFPILSRQETAFVAPVETQMAEAQSPVEAGWLGFSVLAHSLHVAQPVAPTA